MKSLFAGFRVLHHSESSGYHQVVRFIQSDYFDANKLLFGEYSFESIKKRFNMLFFETFLSFYVRKYDIVHFLYPESHLLWCPLFSKRKTKLVATVHLPFLNEYKNASRDSLKEFVRSYQLKVFNRLDGIITLSKEEAERFKRQFPNAIVRFIPHGITIPNESYEIFSEPIFGQEELNIVIIGENFRDLDLIEKLISLGAEKKYRFHLLGISRTLKEKVRNYKNVNVYPYLNEIDYHRVIYKCHVHFLPLEQATANNALLEAHALGVPSVCSNLNSIADYSVSTTCFYNNIDEAINKLDYYLECTVDEYWKIRKETQKEAQKYSWDSISKRIQDLYKELLQN